MNHSPTLNTEPPKSGVGERNAFIAIAIMTAPEPCPVLFCKTCVCVLAGALRRASVPVIAEVPVANPIAAVSIFAVPWSQRMAAVTALKQALAEMELLNERTFMASKSGEDVWVTMHNVGLGITEAQFQNAFLPEDYEEKTIAAFTKWKEDERKGWQTLLHEFHRGPRENPQAS